MTRLIGYLILMVPIVYIVYLIIVAEGLWILAVLPLILLVGHIVCELLDV